MAMYVQSDELKSIAKLLKAKFPHNLSDANLERIVFLMELESDSKTKLATTKKIDNITRAIYGSHDYLVVVFNKRWQNLTPAQRHILVMQQLMHCELGGEKLRKYDAVDFFELASKFGLSWSDDENVQDPLAEDFNEVLTPKPVTEPDKYANIMEEDHGIGSNMSSQYHENDEE